MRRWLLLSLVLLTTLTVVLPASAADSDIERAKALLAEMRTGKVSDDAYDKQIDELVGMGQSVVPLLIETLGRNDDADHFRKLGAIKALGRISDSRVVPALQSAVAVETEPRHLEAELVALLTQDSSATTVDYVAWVIEACNPHRSGPGPAPSVAVGPARQDAFQELVIRAVGSDEISAETRLAVFSHYNRFSPDGKEAVIAVLRRIDNAEAFARLSAILARGTADHFEAAAEALGQLKNSDPMPVLLEALKTATPVRLRDWILAFGERKYQPAAPVLKERVAGLDANAYATPRICMLAAGILCSLGDSYEHNAEVVRDGLMDDSLRGTAYKVAGWLSDDETVKVVCSRIDAEPTQAIPILGKMGSPSALPTLRAEVLRSRKHWRLIGDAISEIGKARGDQSLVAEGEGLTSLETLVGIERWQRLVFDNDAQALQWLESGAAYIRQHPEIIPLLFAGEEHGGRWIVNTIDKGWTPESIPYLEEVMVTNTHQVTFNVDGRQIPHYDIRRQVSGLLSKKTGRPYTYVDADGTIRPAGELPR